MKSGDPSEDERTLTHGQSQNEPSMADPVRDSTAQILNKLLVQGFALKHDTVDGSYRVVAPTGDGRAA